MRLRIIVCSDTHRDFNRLHELIELQKGHADLFLHLGDGARELDDLLALEPDLPLVAVRGNCDWGSLRPDTELVRVGGIGIFLTHGHLYDVRHSLSPLASAARAQGASIACFGHSHCQCLTTVDGIQLLNPGSLSQPRDGRPGYGVIELVDGQALCHLVPWRR